MKYLFLLMILFLIVGRTSAQQQIEVDGSLRLGNNTDSNPDPGTIRWTGFDFMGWNGNDWISLTTGELAQTVTDIDGNVYLTVQIGSQVWMAENLRTTRYQDGSLINFEILPPNPHQWIYNNEPTNLPVYGRLYDWSVVTSSKGICPAGWHVPSFAEWEIIELLLGGPYPAGVKLKEAGTTHWLSATVSAFSGNESGFTGLPGGRRDENRQFIGINLYGYWWSSTDLRSYMLSYDNGSLTLHHNTNVNWGLSIRCVQDTP